MLQRRGVRELLTSESLHGELVESPGSSSSATGQPDLDPRSGDDLADLRKRDPRSAAHRGRRLAPSRSGGSAASSS